MNGGRRLLVALGLGVLLVGPRSAAQSLSRLRPYEEPAWMTLWVNRSYIGVYTEIFNQQTTSSGYTSEENRWFAGPSLGVDLGGTIYHPNFVIYRLNLDGSYGRQHDEISGPGGTSSADEYRFLGSFNGELLLLDSKPLHGRIYANYIHTYQDYDFFNRVYVDTWRYAGSLHYTTGPWSFNASVSRETSEYHGQVLPTDSQSMNYGFDVTHTRSAGRTSLAGMLRDYDRTDYGASTSGQNYTLSLNDTEDFGDRKQFHSLVNASYNRIESYSLPTDLYNVSSSLRVDHSEDLNGQYTVNAARSTVGDARNESINGSANLQHQLFDSLTSTLSLDGYKYKATSGPSRQESWQVGGGPGFTYTKLLGEHTTLTASEDFSLAHTEVDGNGGIIPVIDEAHTFGTAIGGSFTLRQPYVIVSSIVVTDTSNNPPLGYLQGVDYDVIVNGQLVVIQRLAGSSMPNSVLVDYSFYSSPSGAYNTINNACGLRLDFFDHHWSVYTRLTINDNSGDEYLTVQDLTAFVVGTEGNWRWFRAGVEYENYDSSLSPYEAIRFFQTVTLTPQDRSSLSINFTESFIDYQAASRTEENYTATLRYNHKLTRHLALGLDLGASQRVATGLDQTVAIFRPQLNYVVGKFSAMVGYDFGYDEYFSSQERIRNMGYLRVRKEF